MNKTLPLIYLICASIILFLSACSLNYGKDAGLEESVPEIIFEDVDFSRYEEGKKSILLQGKKLEQYKSSGKIFAKDVDFKMLNNEGDATSSGNCGLLVANNSEKTYLLLNGLDIHNIEKNITISAEDLLWNTETEQLTGTKEGIVSVKKGDTLITGKGFSASGISGKFRFISSIKGYFKDDDTTKSVEDKKTK